MSFIADIVLPAEGFVLSSALRTDGVERIEFDCTLPARGDIMPYLWVWGSRFGRFERAMDDDPAVESTVLVDELDSTNLYRVSWQSGIPDLLDALRTSAGVVRELSGETAWEMEILFEDRSALHRFRDCSADAGFEFELAQVYPLGDALGEHGDLTPAQCETLKAAEETGYFEQPRDITMEELADELGVSPSAVSGRMRRATSELVQNSLF